MLSVMNWLRRGASNNMLNKVKGLPLDVQAFNVPICVP